MRFERGRRAEHFDKVMEGCAEVVVDGFSRRQLRDGEVQLLSKLDRFVTNAHSFHLQATGCSSVLRSQVLDTSVPSGHVGVELRFSAPASGRSSAIPRSGLSPPMFLHMVEEALRAVLDVEAGVGKHVVRRASYHDGRHMPAWQAHSLHSARTAWACRDEVRLRRAIDRLGDGSAGEMFLVADGGLRLIIAEETFATALVRATQQALSECPAT